MTPYQLTPAEIRAISELLKADLVVVLAVHLDADQSVLSVNAGVAPGQPPGVMTVAKALQAAVFRASRDVILAATGKPVVAPHLSRN